MEIFDLLEDYLVDQDDGLKKLLTWFLNLVMQLEAIQQSGAEPMSEMPREQLNAMAIKSDLLKRALETWNLKNLNLETVRLNPVFLINILAWR